MQFISFYACASLWPNRVVSCCPVPADDIFLRGSERDHAHWPRPQSEAHHGVIVTSDHAHTPAHTPAHTRTHAHIHLHINTQAQVRWRCLHVGQVSPGDEKDSLQVITLQPPTAPTSAISCIHPSDTPTSRPTWAMRCRNFQTNRSCPFGSSCFYPHLDAEGNVVGGRGRRVGWCWCWWRVGRWVSDWLDEWLGWGIGGWWLGVWMTWVSELDWWLSSRQRCRWSPIAWRCRRQRFRTSFAEWPQWLRWYSIMQIFGIGKW